MLELPKILWVFLFFFLVALRLGWQIRVVPVPPAASTQPDTLCHLRPHRWQWDIPPPLPPIGATSPAGFVPFALEREQGRELLIPSVCPSPIMGLLGTAGEGDTVPSAQQVAPEPHQSLPTLSSTGQMGLGALCWVVVGTLSQLCPC